MAHGPLELPQHWIAVVAQDRAARAVAGGYAELNQGRAGILELVRRGDGFVVYSPRTAEPRGEPVQAFTALGYVRDGALYRAELPDGSMAFRVAVDYVPAHPAPVKPLLDQLTFIRNRQHWGAAFRFGALRIGAVDFACIASAMGHTPAATPARAA
jgi:hypothetical protein